MIDTSQAEKLNRDIAKIWEEETKKHSEDGNWDDYVARVIKTAEAHHLELRRHK